MAKQIYRVTFKERFNKDFIQEFKDEKAFENFLMLNFSTKKQLKKDLSFHPDSDKKVSGILLCLIYIKEDDSRYKKQLLKCSIEVACNYTVHNDKDAEYVAGQIANIFGKTIKECNVQKCYWNDVIFFNAETFVKTKCETELVEDSVEEIKSKKFKPNLMKKEFTKEYMLENEGCYSEEQLNATSFMKLESITIESIIESEISLKDKFWFVINKTELSIRNKQEIAISCAEIVLPIYEAKYPKNKAPREAIQAAKDYLDGKISKDELLVKRIAYVAPAAAAYAADAAYASAADAYDADDADDAYAVYAAAVYAADDAYAAAAYAVYAADAAENNKFNVELLNYLINFIKTN